jgi:hypothetical protein
MTSDRYRKLLKSPFLFWWFKLSRLPSIWFWGLKVKFITEEESIITLKHNFFNKNPFKSIYFSALMGTAEFSTGILVQQAIMDAGNTSMLVIESKAKFLKKATGVISFECNQGKEVYKIISGLKMGDTATFLMNSIGKNSEGVVVLNAEFLWSFKKK